MKIKLFHATTSLNDALSILENGLRASLDGYIYLLTTDKVALEVAYSQLGCTENFGVIKVDPKGIFSELEPDKVGEFTAKYQVRVKQSLIESKYLKLAGMYNFDFEAVQREYLTRFQGMSGNNVTTSE